MPTPKPAGLMNLDKLPSLTDMPAKNQNHNMMRAGGRGDGGMPQSNAIAPSGGLNPAGAAKQNPPVENKPPEYER